jgi:hypothetical protein
MRWIVVALCALLMACGEDDAADSAESAGGEEGAAELAQALAESAIAGDWGAVYDDLHPAQQAVVNRDLFVSCRATLTAPPYNVSTTQVGHDAMTAPEIFDEDAWAVMLSFQLDGYESLTHTMHIYQDDDATSWYMNQTSIDAFRAGRCDVEPQLASDFAVQIAQAEIAGDWATVYDGLHPAQKAVVPRELFLECRASDTVQATNAAAHGVITETFEAPQVPPAESYAVTLALTMPDQSTTYGTLHIFDVEGSFAWVLGEESIGPFSAGQCD